MSIADDDQGVYVDDIVEGSLAEKEGTAKVGMRVVSANGVDLTGEGKHDAAVHALTHLSLILAPNSGQVVDSKENRSIPVAYEEEVVKTVELQREVGVGFGIHVSDGTEKIDNKDMITHRGIVFAFVTVLRGFSIIRNIAIAYFHTSMQTVGPWISAAPYGSCIVLHLVCGKFGCPVGTAFSR